MCICFIELLKSQNYSKLIKMPKAASVSKLKDVLDQLQELKQANA
jgi:hypothetical protein